MPANLSNPFGESCCDGGQTYANDFSAQPCGCDRGAKWVCQRHRDEGETLAYLRGQTWTVPEDHYKPYNEVTMPAPTPKPLVYSNPLEAHLHEVVNVTWNYAGRLEGWKDHVLNAVMGLAGEAAEVLDEHKKLLFHAEKDRSEEIKLELGDVCYYLGKTLDLHGLTLEEVLEANKKKLFERHGVNKG